MCIYNYSDKCRKNSCGFYFFIKLKKFPLFSKLHCWDDFFKNDPKLGENKAQFEEKIEV